MTLRDLEEIDVTLEQSLMRSGDKEVVRWTATADTDDEEAKVAADSPAEALRMLADDLDEADGEADSLESWWKTVDDGSLERHDWSAIVEALHERADGLEVGDHIDQMRAEELRGVAGRVAQQVNTQPPSDLIEEYTASDEDGGDA
ncbi:hypothetical protein [Natrinema thermotolerans]